jgi:hypothetical protein
MVESLLPNEKNPPITALSFVSSLFWGIISWVNPLKNMMNKSPVVI